MQRPTVSIIYVNYNSSDLLIDSVESVREKCNTSFIDFLIVDNASNQVDIEKIERWAADKDDVRFIQSAQNLGFGKANNLAAKHAKGKYLFFLNPDTLIINDVVSIFSNFLESAEANVVACGGNLLKPDFSPNDSYGNYPGFLLELCNVGLGLRFFFNDHFKKNVAIAAQVHTDEVFKVPYVVGADIFIRADKFNEIGGFDEKFFMYYEETDLFHRLAQKGYYACIVPEAKIVHLEGASIGESRGQFNLNKFRILLNSKLHYFWKWHPSYSLPLLRSIVFMQILVQYAKGNAGNDLRSLMRIYFNAIRS